MNISDYLNFLKIHYSIFSIDFNHYQFKDKNFQTENFDKESIPTTYKEINF